MANNKNISYDVKVAYGSTINETNKVRSSIEQLLDAVNRLKRNTNINVKFTGIPKSMDKAVTTVASLSNAMERLEKTSGKTYGTLDGVSQRLKQIKVDSVDMAKGLKESAKAISDIEKNTKKSNKYYKQQSTSKQISNLKNQADVLYQAWRAGNVQSSEYTNKMNAIRSRLSGLYESQRTVNNLTKEQIGLLKQWGFELNAVGSRMGYLATRFAALWVGDQLMTGLHSISKVEKEMAGFAQVMKHGTGETNAFSKSLLEVDPSNMINALKLTDEEATHFKHNLNDMQEKLQGLATKYGTTSHEMIESAKLWGRAYKDNNTVLALTDAATKLAVADAFDIVSANKALESSIMQWGFEISNANDAMSVSSRIIDSWTALAHNYTVSAQTLSEANKRMAQSAKEVGVSFHSAQALISVMARKTQAEGGEIGNALKSIFGSIHSNKAITELQKFGIEVYNFGENGEKSFRKVDDVLLDLMIKADNSKESLEGLLKAISGGKWQWNKADAMLDLTEYLEALKQSASSYGFTDAQVGMQLDTIETKIKQISAQWEKMMSSSHTLGSFMKGSLDIVLTLLKWLDKVPSSIFMITTATLVALAVQRNYGIVSTKVLTGISAQWAKATAHIQAYIIKAQQASTATTSVGRSMATVKGGIIGVGTGLKSLMGGWLGVISVIAMAATMMYEFADEMMHGTAEIEKSYSSHQKLLQQYQETYARLEESKNIISQYISIHEKLKVALENTTLSEQDKAKMNDQLKSSEEGLINILGEEAAAQVLAGTTTEEQSQIAMQAINNKKLTLEKAMERERNEIVRSANALRKATNDNIESLRHESKGWIDRIMLMVKYLDVINLVKYAYASMMETIGTYNQKRREQRGIELQKDFDEATQEAEKRAASGDAKGAKAFQNQADEIARQIGLNKADVEDAKRMQSEAQEEKKRITELAVSELRVSSYEKLASLDNTQSSGHVDSGVVGGGNTGEYHRNELSDEDDDGGNAKGKSTRGKTPKEADVSSILDAANEQLGLAYELGGDGTWATDCGKLVSDATMKAFGKDIPRYVPDIMSEAMSAGAWHDFGDGYIPRAGDGVVVLGDNHIVISDGKGGYTGANSSTGVVAKESVEADFGNATGYIDMAKMLGLSSASDSKTAQAKAKKIADREQKAKELEQKLNSKMEELSISILPQEQAELAKKTNDLNKKINEITNDMTELKKLNPKADVSAFKETLQKYIEVMNHRIQDEDTMRRFDKAETHMKDTQAMQKLELDGIAENFWTSDIREVQFVNEQLEIAKKKLEYIQEAISRGDSNFSDEDLRKATIAVKQLDNESKKLAKTLKEDVRKQTHDVFHSLIFEGQSIKDVWKNLWKQLAEDALKMMFKINDGKGGLLQNLLKMKDKKYLAGINGVNGKDGANGKIGGIDESLNQQMLTAQSTRNLDQNFALFMQNTQGGTAWNQATFTDAVIYGTTEGNSKDIELPEGNKESDKKDDISKYINAGMKLGNANTGWGKALGIAGTLAGFAQQFGLLHFASGGYVNKDQLVRVGEGNKKEWIIPTSNKSRGRQLLGQAAKDLDIGFTSGIEPKWQHEDTAKGALHEQTKRQDKLMSRMVANSEAMTRGMNYMANNGSNTSESIAQPVFVKQTISDQDFLAKYQKLVALGKMRRA